MKIIYVIACLYIAYYTMMFAMKVKREGNKLGAVAIGLLSAVVIATPVVVLFFIK